MAHHTHHPPSHTHGLADDCPECVSSIENPNRLDLENLARIWRGEHHTRTDLKTYDTLYRRAVTINHLQRALGVDVPSTHTSSIWSYGGRT